ncbi:MAG: transposase [Rhodobacteraceae bacterium]|jgi:transposase|nr:transposase [Paracoccaceae bacterium]
MTISTVIPTTGSFQLVEAVVEQFDGAAVGERRRWSDGFKTEAVEASLEPGINVSALARRLRLTPSQLLGWRKAFLDKQEASRGEHPWMPPVLIEILVGDITIRVGAYLGAQAQMLRPDGTVTKGLNRADVAMAIHRRQDHCGQHADRIETDLGICPGTNGTCGPVKCESPRPQGGGFQSVRDRGATTGPGRQGSGSVALAHRSA